MDVEKTTITLYRETFERLQILKSRYVVNNNKAATWDEFLLDVCEKVVA